MTHAHTLSLFDDAHLSLDVYAHHGGACLDDAKTNHHFRHLVYHSITCDCATALGIVKDKLHHLRKKSHSIMDSLHYYSAIICTSKSEFACTSFSPGAILILAYFLLIESSKTQGTLNFQFISLIITLVLVDFISTDLDTISQLLPRHCFSNIYPDLYPALSVLEGKVLADAMSPTFGRQLDNILAVGRCFVEKIPSLNTSTAVNQGVLLIHI